MVNKLTEENTQLKLIIEDLEQKNKRFSETLNTHLYTELLSSRPELLMR